MKDKTKKILKGVGLGLGSIVILALGVGIGACSVKNGSTQPITTTPVRKGLNQNPRKAEGEGVYILNDFALGGYGIDMDGTYKRFNSGASLTWSTYGLNPYSSYTLPLGYYRVSSEGTFSIFKNPSSGSKSSAWLNFVDADSTRTDEVLHAYSWNEEPALIRLNSNVRESYLYYSGTEEFYFNGIYSPILELVNTLEVPPSSVINFPSNWSPMSLISDNLSVKGGYAFVDVSPASYQTLVPITISLKQNLFRYDGKVYDEMVFTFVDLSHGDGYIQDDGQPWKPWEKTTSELSSSLHVFGLYSLRFNASFNGDTIVALSPVYSDSPFQTGGDGTYYPPTVYLPTGEYRWVNPKVTYIEIVDKNFGQGSTRYNGRYSDYSDLDLLVYLNGYSSEGNLLAVGASGGVFELMSNAFTSVLPLLSVQVLPNLTLGILLFLPLIGAIIVIIIRVIKK